jgi:hypothetical protein
MYAYTCTPKHRAYNAVDSIVKLSLQACCTKHGVYCRFRCCRALDEHHIQLSVIANLLQANPLLGSHAVTAAAAAPVARGRLSSIGEHAAAAATAAATTTAAVSDKQAAAAVAAVAAMQLLPDVVRVVGDPIGKGRFSTVKRLQHAGAERAVKVHTP